MIYKNASRERVTVPFHVSKTLHPGILKSVLRGADLTVEELKKLL